jgi:PQQ-dependent dehydrogenase (methanol/ethanol family)
MSRRATSPPISIACAEEITVNRSLLPLLVLAACHKPPSPHLTHTGYVTDVRGALPNIHLVSPLPEGEWHLPAGDYAHTRYSPLSLLDTTNAPNLKPITVLSTGVAKGHEGGPLVVGDTMYVVTPFPNNLIAVDLKKPGGALRWIYEPHPDRRAVGIACCDVVNRGASYADGKIVYNLLDATTVAIDAESGKELWRTRIGNIDIGETTTMAALVVKDKVLVGVSGGELGVRGWIAALDLKTGKQVWRAYSSGPDQDALLGKGFHPYYDKDRGTDLGVSGWPKDQWKLGGGTVWGWVSYDPELDLIYYGTGNPGVWNADLRPGDNHWSMTIFARNPDTGEARWAYQVTPHDHWDYDEIMENVLVDMDWQGKPRKLLLHPARNGFMFVMDRQTGEVLSAEKFVESTNWAERYDLKTGRPVENPAKITKMNVVVEDICPSSTGAKEFVPSAFSPRTGLLYIPAHNTCMAYEDIEANYIAGTPYLGADVRMYPGPGGYQGELIAWDPIQAKKVWGIRDERLPVYSGVLATGGDLVFYGTMDGWFRAVDARSGAELWKFHTGSGIVGNPITYIGPDKKQYVAVYSGVGGWMGAVAQPTVSADDPYAALGVVGAMADLKKVTAPGGALYVFGL